MKTRKQKKNLKWAEYIDSISKDPSVIARKMRADDRMVERRKRKQFRHNRSKGL